MPGITTFCSGPFQHHAKIANSVSKKVERDFRMFVSRIIWEVQPSDLPASPNCVLEFQIGWGENPGLSEEALSELAENVSWRLSIYMLDRGFLPIRENGEILYILEPYGFSVVLGIGVDGGEEELEQVFRKLVDEIPTPVEANVHQIEEYHGTGQLFQADIALNDYRPAWEREQFMLAVYFRLIILASARGFFAITPSLLEAMEEESAE